MRRRTYLESIGAIGTVGLAGCLGGGGPPAPANEFDYPTLTVDDVEVPLAPVDDAYAWYADDAGVFVDARSRTAYGHARIEGAVLSPAPDGRRANDPIEDLSRETRLVTYCGCPHHLSTLRGSVLIQDGYVHTYAIDEGFQGWIDAGYPLAGSAVQDRPAPVVIEGLTDRAAAGALAWVWHDATAQREAAPIDATGRFTLEMRFHDVTPSSVLRVVTPTGEVSGPLEALTAGVVEV